MENIIFRKSWFKTLKRWEPKKVYEFLLVLERFSDKKELDLPDYMLDFWDQVEPLLQSDIVKYGNKVEANRENGKLGGRPKKPNLTQENPMGYLETKETQPNPKNPKEKEKEKEIDKEIDKEKDIDIDKELIKDVLGKNFDEKMYYEKNKATIHFLMDNYQLDLDAAIELQIQNEEVEKVMSRIFN
jgi:hypothetical protein